MQPPLGLRFEREIREQPRVWERIAASSLAARLAAALDAEVVLVGSGSSLFAAQLGALALRRRRIAAQALAATEARLDHNAYENRTVVALSQSGSSSDLLAAIDVLRPRRLVVLTNTPASPLGARADLTLDVGAGPELAVPASKSVSATVAILLWAASLASRDGHRTAGMLARAARGIATWLDRTAAGEVGPAAAALARCASVLVLGSDYGAPVASETALKLKEASYLHAEGFAAGEFRHGSIAMVDASSALLGIVDTDAFEIVARPLAEAAPSGALRYAIGTQAPPGVARLGPLVDAPFNALAWLVTAQMLALYASRARHVDADAPRGLRKTLVSPPP